MKTLTTASAALLLLVLSACDRPVAPVVVTPTVSTPPTVVAVPGPAGEPGKTSTDTVVIVPARP